MPHHIARNAPELNRPDDLLDDLELRFRTDVSSARGLATYRRKVAVTVRPANALDRDVIATTGYSTELRRLGAVCLGSRPVMVGSFFLLTFDRADLDVAPALAVCDRSAMLGDASFELSFKFVQEIDLPVAGEWTGDQADQAR